MQAESESQYSNEWKSNTNFNLNILYKKNNKKHGNNKNPGIKVSFHIRAETKEENSCQLTKTFK